MVSLPDLTWIEPWFMKNTKWVISTLLIFITLYVTTSSYFSQRKSNMRESIEQLHELHISDNMRVQPLLHRMQHMRGKTTFAFKFYLGKEFEGASKPGSADLLPYLDEIKKKIRNNDSVSSVKENELADSSKNLLVTCDSTDAVKCRRTVEECLSVVKSVSIRVYFGEDEELKEEIKKQIEEAELD